MKKLIAVLLSCVLGIMLPSVNAEETTKVVYSPIGYWKTIDDVSGQPKSIVQFYLSDKNELTGKVVKLFKGALEYCSACQGNLKNKPILGMVVVKGLKQLKKNPNIWKDGEALDPKNGKTYHCMITVVENGQKLNARGYIGIPLFGRTQTWIRVKGPAST